MASYVQLVVVVSVKTFGTSVACNCPSFCSDWPESVYSLICLSVFCTLGLEHWCIAVVKFLIVVICYYKEKGGIVEKEENKEDRRWKSMGRSKRRQERMWEGGNKKEKRTWVEVRKETREILEKWKKKNREKVYVWEDDRQKWQNRIKKIAEDGRKIHKWHEKNERENKTKNRYNVRKMKLRKSEII